MNRPARRPPRAGLALVLVLMLVIVLVVLVAVIDSSDSTSSNLGLRTRPGSSATPGPVSTTTGTGLTATSATVAPANVSSDHLPSRPSSTPTASDPLRLWVGGDSLAAGPSWAVFEDATKTGVVKPLAEYQVGTGLVRNEFWDWPRHMDAVVRARNPQISVFMVGANDDQGIEVNGASYLPPSPEWTTEYTKRVDALMATLTRDGRRLIWIGMPPMQDAAYSQSMNELNQVFQSEAAKYKRVTYLDAWTMFSAPGSPGTYASDVPDTSGQLTNVRLDDGIHLNVAGSQLLSQAVMADLAKMVNLPPS
ncbi:MAG TPA: DUF459 domain-containing protein [Acidimicrobiia bacterium]